MIAELIEALDGFGYVREDYDSRVLDRAVGYAISYAGTELSSDLVTNSYAYHRYQLLLFVPNDIDEAINSAAVVSKVYGTVRDLSGGQIDAIDVDDGDDGWRVISIDFIDKRSMVG